MPGAFMASNSILGVFTGKHTQKSIFSQINGINRTFCLMPLNAAADGSILAFQRGAFRSRNSSMMPIDRLSIGKWLVFLIYRDVTWHYEATSSTAWMLFTPWWLLFNNETFGRKSSETNMPRALSRPLSFHISIANQALLLFRRTGGFHRAE